MCVLVWRLEWLREGRQKWLLQQEVALAHTKGARVQSCSGQRAVYNSRKRIKFLIRTSLWTGLGITWLSAILATMEPLCKIRGHSPNPRREETPSDKKKRVRKEMAKLPPEMKKWVK